MKQAATPEFKTYQQQVVKNCQMMCKGLMDKGYTIVTGMAQRDCYIDTTVRGKKSPNVAPKLNHAGGLSIMRSFFVAQPQCMGRFKY